MELVWRDGGKCRAISEKCVQPAATAGGNGLAESEGFDDRSAERFAIGAGDDDISSGDFGQGGFVRRVEGQCIVQPGLGSHLL